MDPAGPVRHAESTSYRILRPGRNCWRLARASRFAWIIDAADYFAAVAEALASARQSILIVAWDFDSRITLRPDVSSPQPIGEFLTALVEARPELVVRLLVWDWSVVYGSSGDGLRLFGNWPRHERIQFRFDSSHPIGASHHQKIVCIDDRLAFVGGMDLTAERWDTPGHWREQPLRITADGGACPPVHDVQAVVDGPAAAALAELARQRWLEATGEAIPAADGSRDLWPSAIRPGFRDVEVAIARTLPPGPDRAAVREVEALTIDALAAARRWIYLEAQYFTAEAVGDVLERRLAAAEGPEILVAVVRHSSSWVERLVMGENRDRLLRRLAAADHAGRLRVFWLSACDDRDCEVKIHSKVVAADGRFLRIGSSNLNNRSMGLDTECDLAIEARRPAEAAAIDRFRDELLAEHLCTTPEAVAAAVAEHGSLLAAVDALNAGPEAGRLHPYEVDPDGSREPIPGTSVLDPDEPYDLGFFGRLVGLESQST